MASANGCAIAARLLLVSNGAMEKIKQFCTDGIYTLILACKNKKSLLIIIMMIKYLVGARQCLD